IKQLNKKPIATKYREVIEKIKDTLFEKYDTKHLWNEGALIAQLEALETHLKSSLKDSFSYFVDKYCDWLVDDISNNVNLDKLFYSTKLFDPENGILKQFMDVWQEKERQENAKAHSFKETFGRDDDDEETE